MEKYGRNEVRHEKEVSWLRQLVDAFVNPFIGILIFIAVVSAIIDVDTQVDDRDYSTVIMVVVMVTVSVVLKFVQEYRSSNAARRLKDMVETTATVERDGEKSEIDIHDIVPGRHHPSLGGRHDSRRLPHHPGQKRPLRGAVGTHGRISVEKKPEALDEETAGKSQVIELSNIGFMGTNVVSGTALAVAVTTGEKDLFRFAEQNDFGQTG